MLQPGNYGNHMLSVSFFYCGLFFFTPHALFLTLLLKILEFLPFLLLHLSLSLLWRFSLPPYSFSIYAFKLKMLELMQLLLCPHCASKWMLALILLGLRLVISQNHTRDSSASSFVCEYENMYFVKSVSCRINYNLNARFCKQQKKVVAVVTAVYTEK